jgi:hypothetical protein
MSKEGKDLFSAIEGMIDFGHFIPSSVIHQALGIAFPDVASKKEFDSLALMEMSAVDYVRNILLGRGMYIRGVHGGYRILSISENMEQVDQYMKSADRKLRRGIKLLKNSPKKPGEYPDQQEALAEMKRENISAYRNKIQITSGA